MTYRHPFRHQKTFQENHENVFYLKRVVVTARCFLCYTRVGRVQSWADDYLKEVRMRSGGLH